MSALLYEIRRRGGYLPAVAGISELISIVLPWWFAKSSSALLNVSILSLGGLSNGAIIGIVNINPLGNAVLLIQATLAISCVLSFIGVRYRVACILGIVAILAGVATFASVMNIALWIGPGPQLGLWGALSATGDYTFWGFSWGFYLTMVSTLLLVVSSIFFKRIRNISLESSKIVR